MQKQYTTDAEGEMGGGDGGRASSSSFTSLNNLNLPTEDQSDGVKQPMNSVPSAVSLPGAAHGRTSGAGNGDSPSSSTTSFPLNRRQGGTQRPTRASAPSNSEPSANQEASEKEELDHETRLEMYVE